mmetsp:Transcript_21715/g.73255  ORF Transcript_21715/g.73255 Transcript_21715/m.73255 type:complete len:129 (+) Transcript_21715:57-443(+)
MCRPPPRSSPPTEARTPLRFGSDFFFLQVLLTPLLQPGSADVVFDTLSYSAGPLPEQQLADTRLEAPVLVLYGEQDPWTPPARVRALERFAAVQRVVPLPGVGHCPHDEAPGTVNPLVLDFVRACAAR